MFEQKHFSLDILWKTTVNTTSHFMVWPKRKTLGDNVPVDSFANHEEKKKKKQFRWCCVIDSD